ncbi:MAG: hypothetical protein ACREVJ_13785, partial [Gammaproteobacteria bacterium]
MSKVYAAHPAAFHRFSGVDIESLPAPSAASRFSSAAPCSGIGWSNLLGYFQNLARRCASCAPSQKHQAISQFARRTLISQHLRVHEGRRPFPESKSFIILLEIL